jgi:hypothetical protein
MIPTTPYVGGQSVRSRFNCNFDTKYYWVWLATIPFDQNVNFKVTIVSEFVLITPCVNLSPGTVLAWVCPVWFDGASVHSY